MIYLIHKVDAQACIFSKQAWVTFKEFQKHGVTLLSEAQFIHTDISSEDTVIIYISFQSDAAREKLAAISCKKIVWTVDESKSDGVLFRTVHELCDQIGSKSVILTYPSERNISHLVERGYETFTLPFSITALRPRAEKTIDIVISGQLDHVYYPVRTRLVELLQQTNRYKIAFLPHPGNSYSEARHTYIGEKYYELLDQCKLGVTCHAGKRDRMLLKYIEYGTSWCLPIGDKPSYMNEAMASSMVSVDASVMLLSTLIVSIDEALANYEERILQYTGGLIADHDLQKNVNKLMLQLLLP